MDGCTHPARGATHRGLRIVPAKARARLAGLWRAAAAGVSRAAINRRVVERLAAMSDRELRDIGLVRQDVFDSAALGPSGDASDFLIGRRDARRRAPRPIPHGSWPPRRG